MNALTRPTLSGAAARRIASNGARIVVVGASGWLGLASLELLRNLLGSDFDRRVVCFGSSDRALPLRGGVSVMQRSLDQITDLPEAPTLVLHLAFLTQEKLINHTLESYRAANRAISGRVLAALGPLGATAAFVPSSGAVYSVGEEGLERRKQLYGQLKREDEDRFSDWSVKQGTRAVVSRVFNLSGPYINKQQDYALACFIADALADRPIRIQATQPVYRSFVAIRELMSVVFSLLTDGETGPILFDTAGERAYEMSEIAEVVCTVLGRPQEIDRPILSRTDSNLYLGDGTAYAALCRAQGVELVDFPNQILETARYMATASMILASPSDEGSTDAAL